MLEGTLLPVDVLLVGVEVEKRQELPAGVVRPEGGHDFFFHGAGVTETKDFSILVYNLQ